MPASISRFLMPTLFALLAATLSAQIAVSPGGGSVRVGDSIRMLNLGAGLGSYVLSVDNTALSGGLLFPGYPGYCTVPRVGGLEHAMFVITVADHMGVRTSYPFKIIN